MAGRAISFTVARAKGSAANSCDTPQVYFSYPAAATDPRVPAKVLRHFEKVCGDSQVVTYTFSDRDVSNWSVAAQEWAVTSGTFGVSVGSSSQDIRLKGSFVM